MAKELGCSISTISNWRKKLGIDFSSLHDLMLYVLLPCINGGAVEYNHPLINATTELLLNSKIDCNFGDFGQNRLFLFAKNQK